jgi:glycosyltransferase involved in cell wall biosynthesis
MLTRVASLVRSYRPDLVQANGSDTLKYSVLARQACLGRWRLVYRNISIASRWLRNSAHLRWNRWLVRQTDHVVAVSQTSGADFSKTYAVPAGRVSVIPQSVQVPELAVTDRPRAVLAQSIAAPRDAILLLHVGSFTHEKNHLWLLEVFRRLRLRNPAVHLVLIGDGPLHAVVDDRIGQLGLSSSVHMLGTRPDARELVAAADILVLPSLVEGLPAVVLEAAAQSVPAVASDVGGVREAIRHGHTGLLVPPADMDAFLAAVTTLVDNTAQRRTMGARARELVRREYDFGAALVGYEELYLRLLGRTGVDTSCALLQPTLLGRTLTGHLPRHQHIEDRRCTSGS